MKTKRRWKKGWWIFAAFWICWIIFGLTGMKLRTSDSKAQAEFQKQFVTAQFLDIIVDGVKLHYVKTGNDTLPTLFFIHGSPGSWDAYQRYLADKELLKKFRMIAIDRPGFGYSNFGHAYYLEEQAKLIYGIVEHEKNNRPLHLIGHSLGGPVVVKLAQNHPEAYSSLVILAGSISPLDEPLEKWRPIFINNPLQYLLPGAFRTCNTEIWYFKKELYGMENNYDHLTMPITFIHGDKDSLVSVKNVSYGMHRLTFNHQVQKIIIPGANHFIPWEHFDVIKNHLLTLAN